METHVFVYGTLRKDTRGQVLSPLCRDWIFLGYGTVAGELYDFGAYPGAVRADGTDAHIFGEVYELSDPEAMIPPIDRYEGCSDENPRPHEFERALVDVAMEGGTVRRAWIYWYASEPLGRRVESGDYLHRTGDRRPGR
jgi:gamma-glutamylcyclotransferase (GGCT)/AIG2-like uncharacterized protein YtfP